MTDIGFRIKSLRKERKITQSEFAKKICVSQSYLSRVENNKELPTDMLLKLISLEYKCSYEWLKQGIGNMEINENDYYDRMSTKKLCQGLKGDFNELCAAIDKVADAPSAIFSSFIIQALSFILNEENVSVRAVLLECLASLNVEFTGIIEAINNGENIEDRSKYIIGCAECVQKDIVDLYASQK